MNDAPNAPPPGPAARNLPPWLSLAALSLAVAAATLPFLLRGEDPEFQRYIQRVAAVRAKLPTDWQHRLCYQSRVGPMKWLGPSTEQDHRADEDGQAGKPADQEGDRKQDDCSRTRKLAFGHPFVFSPYKVWLYYHYIGIYDCTMNLTTGSIPRVCQEGA